MNDFGLFVSCDGFELKGECMECEKRGVPVVTITERYFSPDAPGITETATICERCLSTYTSQAQEAMEHELRATFIRRHKAVYRV